MPLIFEGINLMRILFARPLRDFPYTGVHFLVSRCDIMTSVLVHFSTNYLDDHPI